MVRLRDFEVTAIKEVIKKYLPDSRVLLYGSRADDSKKGGDIDLLIYTSVEVDFTTKSRIYWEICERIGEQKIDMIFTKEDSNDSFVKLIKPTAVEI
jgi:uncharacterized protein